MKVIFDSRPRQLHAPQSEQLHKFNIYSFLNKRRFIT